MSAMKSNISENKYGKLEENIAALKSTSLLVGITGPSSVGKSSFINNMLGLEEGDEGAAEIGEGDTTTTYTLYSHPKNKNLMFADLPGFGTPSFQMTDAYLKTINAEVIDFFLLFYGTTISEGDIWMIRKLLDLKKQFAIVRTRADDLVGRKGKNLQQRIEEIKMKARENLKKSKIMEQIEIFVISNRKHEIGEFDELFSYIHENLSGFKKVAIILHVSARTDKMIEKKQEQLERRAWKVAAGMGLLTAIPVPGLDTVINLAGVANETHLYLRSFGLTDEILSKVPTKVKEELKTANLIHTMGIQSFIMSYIAKAPVLASAAFIENAIEVLIPVIGSLYTGGTAYAVYINFMLDLIRKLAADAKILRRYHVESVI